MARGRSTDFQRRREGGIGTKKLDGDRPATPSREQHASSIPTTARLVGLHS